MSDSTNGDSTTTATVEVHYDDPQAEAQRIADDAASHALDARAVTQFVNARERLTSDDVASATDVEQSTMSDVIGHDTTNATTTRLGATSRRRHTDRDRS